MTAGLSWMEVTAVAAATVFASVLAWILVRPYRGLAGRLRPYVAVARTRLARSVDVSGQAGTGPVFGQGTFRRLFGPIIEGALARFSRLISFGSEAQLATKLRQAGLYPGLTVQDRVREYRVRSFLFSAGLTVLGGLFGLALRGVAAMLLFGASGFVIGVLFSRSRVDGAIGRRRDRTDPV
jgi:hypothetical protein